MLAPEAAEDAIRYTTAAYNPSHHEGNHDANVPISAQPTPGGRQDDDQRDEQHGGSTEPDDDACPVGHHRFNEVVRPSGHRHVGQ